MKSNYCTSSMQKMIKILSPDMFRLTHGKHLFFEKIKNDSMVIFGDINYI